MEYHTLVIAVLSAFVFAFALISRRISTTIITAPMIFVTFGLLLSTFALDILELTANSELISIVAEITLVLVLFSDASRIRLGTLRKEHTIPTRLLVIGLPVTIILGALLAVWLIGALTFWEAAVLAAILAPTDAALGQAVVTNKRVPVRIRQALNVESGLNDGIALPFLLLFLALADVTEPVGSVAFWVRFTALQLILGPIIGIAAGYFGGKLIQGAVKRGWIDGVFEKLGAVAIALIAYSIADLVGGNGFIAAFVAGLTMGNTARDVCGRVQEFAEAEGQLLTLITFVVFGAVMVEPMIGEFQPIFLVYAILSLTLIRIIPVVISLSGLRLKRNTRLFIGWFGPRGIASVIYALLLFEYDGILNNKVIFGTAVVTILLSVFAHGITAAPFAERYGGTMELMGESEDMMEAKPVSEMPLRVSGK